MMFPRFQSRPRTARPEIPELRIREATNRAYSIVPRSWNRESAN
ncbi:major facilitator family transporter domain protein [Burkholderia thailandensis]|uniref:Major facilitator family transporter domain protein n=1 Tax=Burkholderia thailandensis TaxID=57975 RepID=A0AAW9CTM0_BURTH|nr:major facilitator family transporter domain protein [Burkholderia thailandensis]MDW9254290.1 major facilitator family transporter domain protein [Burkholderia thailandensis]